MAVEIGQATDHVNLFDRLDIFLQTVTPAGPDWEILRGGTTGNLSVLLRAPGLSGLEEIYFGFGLEQDVGLDTYALSTWMFRAFNEALDDVSQPGYSGKSYLPIWNQATPYWFVANKQRLIIVTKVSTTYTALYVGKFLPYSTPGEYPQPFYIGAPASIATDRWSSISENNRNFWDPGEACLMSRPDGQWRTVQNFNDTGFEANKINSNYIWPYQGSGLAGSIDATAKTRYRELRNTVDGGYVLKPLVLHGVDPDLDIYGELHGAYAVSGFNNAAENTVTIAGVVHLVVQNIHRTSRFQYAAIALE